MRLFYSLLWTVKIEKYINLNSSRLKVRAFRDFVPNKLRTGGFSFFAAFLKVIFLIKNKSFDICICDNVHRPA